MIYSLQGNTKSKDTFVPEPGWEWANDWHTEFNKDTDSEGWSYAFDWRFSFSSENTTKSFVRQRKWVQN